MVEDSGETSEATEAVEAVDTEELGRSSPGLRIDDPVHPPGDGDDPPTVESGGPLSVCSFNIMWLGSYKKKENEQLADMLSDYDIVVVQEMVSAPCDGVYPDSTAYEADEEAEAFSNAMREQGFEEYLSEEDTGPGETIHTKTTGTEWFVTYYRPDKVGPATDLPCGFLAEDRSAHPVYRRVPYAFGFRSEDGEADFVLVSVHLNPDSETARKAEFDAMAEWLAEQNEGSEHDFFILGDTNIQDAEELADVLPEGFMSMNSQCLSTNTKPAAGKPYDHVMYSEASIREIDTDYGFWIIDLPATMEDYWNEKYAEPYPGDTTGVDYENYDHSLFSQHYSDHDPIEFRLAWEGEDDD